MKLPKLTGIAFAALIIAACTASKKSKTSSASTAATTTTTTTSTTTTAANPVGPAGPASPFVKPANGVYSPGNEELTALQTKYPNLKDATIEKLQQGYFIYTKGACVKCHGADNIYRHSEPDWVKIIGDMAMRARLTDVDKDAVFNYVIAIKCAQPK